MLKFKTLLGGCCLFCILLSSQAQTISVSENASIKVDISSTETTRIAVSGDRVRVLRGVEGAYSYSNDIVGGAVFLKPSKTYQDTPFYVFVSTEQGHNYLLQLHPTSQLPAGMLILKPKLSVTVGLKKESDSEWASDPPSAQSSIQDWQALIQRMSQHKSASDEKVIPIAQAKPTLIHARLLSSDPLSTKPCQLELTLKTQYIRSGLVGEVYEVHNQNPYPVHLSENLFYTPPDRAIALKNNFLPANGKTEVYKIQELSNV